MTGTNKSGRECILLTHEECYPSVTFIDAPTSVFPILMSLIRITKLRRFATHMCPNLMVVLLWKLLNIVIDILLIR